MFIYVLLSKNGDVIMNNSKTLGIVLIFGSIVVFFVFGLTGLGMAGMMWPYMPSHMMWPTSWPNYWNLGLWWMPLGMVLVWLTVGVGVYFVYSGLVRTSSQDTTLNILRERYARGEISREEYNQLHNELS